MNNRSCDSESAAANSDRDLTQLEESLVCDLLSALIEAFTQNRLELQPDKNIIRKLFPLELKGSEELCKITFDMKKAGQEEGDQEEGDKEKNDKEKDDKVKGDQVYILIQSSKLISVVGKSEQFERGFSADEVSKAILANIQQMPICITAQLDSLVLTLKEIMSIEEGDILLLDKKVNDSIELVARGRTALLGQPAKSTGKYAVVVTKLCNEY